MVRSASGAPGCVAARLTGAGFGGCCVAMVEKALYKEFERSAAASYGIYNFATPNLFETRASGGASAVRLA